MGRGESLRLKLGVGRGEGLRLKLGVGRALFGLMLLQAVVVVVVMGVCGIMVAVIVVGPPSHKSGQ